MANAHDGGDGAIVWEADASAAHFSFVSESASEVLGYPPQQWQAESGFLQKHVHPDDWSRLLQTIYDAATERTSHKCEHRMLRADGSTLWAQTSVHPIERAGAAALSGLTVDVTEVKETEARVRREAARSRRLVENLRGCAAFLVSATGIVETWTQEAKRLTGRSREDVIGRPLSSLFASESAEAIAGVLRAAETQNHATLEAWLVRADGAKRWGALTVAVAHQEESEPACYAVGIVDLTSRHELESDLRRAAEDRQLLVQNVIEHGLWMTAPNGIVKSWNRAAQRLSGFRSHEMIGSPVSTLLPADVVESGMLDRLLEEAAREGASRYEGPLARKDGSTFWGGLYFGAAEDEHEQLRGLATVVRDLTVRKSTEETLRANEKHFRLLVDSVQDHAIFMLSVDGRVASWNRGAQRVCGYRSHEIVGSQVSRFFPLEEIVRGEPARLLERATADGHASYEGWLVRRKGETFWGVMHLDPIEDDETGQLRGFSIVARDLTAQKRAEAALGESEERLRLLIDSVQDYAVFMISPAGNVVSWSKAAERLKGHRGDEIIGMPLARFFPAEELAIGTVDRLFERARTENVSEYEGWLLRKDGSRFWGNVMLGAVRDGEGELRGFSNVARDLTDRMREERAQQFLAEAGQVLAGSLEYRTTLQKVAQLAIRDLADCCIVAIDAGASRHPLAVAHADAGTQEAVEHALAALPRDAAITHGIAQTLETGEPQLFPDVAQAAWFHEEADAEGLWVARDLRVRSFMCVPMIARGQAFGAIAFLSSAPERRYGARDLALAEELARRGALAIENARLFEQAQRAIQMREEVLAIVSHDLRAPLSTILLGAEQLLKQVDEGTAVAKTLGRAARSARRMTHMIDDLLDFSSIEAGRLTLSLRDSTPRELVREVVDMYAPIAREKGIRLADGEAPSVDRRLICDPSRIVQVLSNLVGNAIKFTPSGGVVTLATSLDTEGHTVTFRVTDDGPGIATEDVPHIFERYWQAKKRAAEGVGLGLAISKGLVVAHGGSIRVATMPGKGTSFFVTIPLLGPP